jgi:hypothetical protein
MSESQRIYEQDFWEKAYLRAVGEGIPRIQEIAEAGRIADEMLEQWRARWSAPAPTVERSEPGPVARPDEAKINAARHVFDPYWEKSLTICRHCGELPYHYNHTAPEAAAPTVERSEPGRVAQPDEAKINAARHVFPAFSYRRGVCVCVCRHCGEYPYHYNHIAPEAL